MASTYTPIEDEDIWVEGVGAWIEQKVLVPSVNNHRRAERQEVWRDARGNDLHIGRSERDQLRCCNHRDSDLQSIDAQVEGACWNEELASSGL